MPGLLVVIRHGQTEWSGSGQHTGNTDIPLTDQGRDDARRLRSRLNDRHFELVLCSPLVRAWDTAVLAGLGDQAQVDKNLLEWDYGDYEGLTSGQIRAQRKERGEGGWDIWRDGCPGGE